MIFIENSNCLIKAESYYFHFLLLKVLDSPQKDPVLRCYAQSATLPFAELPANRNSKKVLVILGLLFKHNALSFSH